MTRINCVPVSELVDLHLLAEYKEMPRVINLVKKAIDRGESPEKYIPLKYKMGTGHVTFFYCRLWYLIKRYGLLCDELVRRGFDIQYSKKDFSDWCADIPEAWKQDWEPKIIDMTINRDRLAIRLSEMKQRGLL